MSPLNRHRWQRFKANRRGFGALWLLLILFGFSLFAEWIANDRPLIVSYQGQWYFPLLKDYSEQTFGGDLAIPANYRDDYLVQQIQQQGGWMLWPLIRYRYDTINYQSQTPAPSPPSTENWLGTDDQARDVLARIIYGFRISLLFALLLALFSSVIGIVLGALQGYFGGWLDLLLQRAIEIWSGLPMLFVLILVASLIKPNFWWLLGILVLFGWTTLVGPVRAEFLRGRNFEYVRAARALGVDNLTIIFRHIFPNAMVATLTFLPFVVSGGVISLTALDFLGFGLPPGSPALGELLKQGKDNLHAPWLGISAFVVLAILLSSLVFIGEAVRDAFDPRKT